MHQKLCFSQSANEPIPLVDTLNTETSSSTNLEDDIPEEMLEGTALTSQDWSKAQQSDRNLQFVIDRLKEGQRPTIEQLKAQSIDNGTNTV